ncbi:S1C family serine protease [Natrinema longum]|uniref:Trypsin-like peptidase domain-containing protein n=1 Tax=Natrinema longum TaxID=370324 RepID=A0A8A2UE25_9EURY|nr:trypsin-like peptidase domain-containing protein [Natrinema longum]MBZ6495901.1 trypsin-like peptidase domain-containing protein [Natrinema longum]QSW86158.1 trypsin-like peptidase domain-containing protein [Natrinema longum]
MTPRPTRRRLLTHGGVALLTGVAGCLTKSSDGDSETDEGPRSASGTADSAYTTVYSETIDSVVMVRLENGRGTGFVFDDTHVVTNAHVVGRSSAADVRFNDGSWRSGTVAGRDPHSDLAAISVDDVPSAASPLPFVDDQPRIGREVVAIGNPFDLEGTVTTGIISGTDRSIPAPTGYTIPDAVQTDAAVNPGNSGGPLMTLEGRVAAVINSGGGDNIAFGISAALTERVVPALIETGRYEHAYIGISFTEVTPDVAAANDLKESEGLLVADVVTGGPADGWIKPSDDVRYTTAGRIPIGGDVILAIDGQELTTQEELGSYLALETRPGDTVDLRVTREGSERTVSLELGSRPARRGLFG